MFFAAWHYSIFDDEALSCRLYAMPAGDMLRALWRAEDPDPPLYYLIENTWVRIFGVGPLALRIPSIAMFLAGALALMAAARAWFDPRTAALAALIALLHPAHLFFGFAARWYALVFLLVACLLDLSAPIATGRPRRWVMWGLCAAAICYTNYFGPVIVGMIWLAMMARDRAALGTSKRNIAAAGVAIALFAPWVPVFWHNLTSFPRMSLSPSGYAASALRLGAALGVGNLASPAAWWAWGPIALAGLGAATLAIRARGGTLFIALIALGGALAGVLTGTLIDKYALTISGPFCILMAALISTALHPQTKLADAAPPGNFSSRVARATVGLALVGWCGCVFNLVTERHWSSLRWLDPFEQVTRELYEQNWAHTHPTVCSHPAARYYLARLAATDHGLNAIEKQIEPDWWPVLRTDPRAWLRAWNEQNTPGPKQAYFAMTPDALARQIAGGGGEDRPPLIQTLETTGFRELGDWDELRAELRRWYKPAGDPVHFLHDPDAALKDRLDPGFSHPPWRITVSQWRRRS